MSLARFGLDPLDKVKRPALALAMLVPAPTIGALMAIWLAPGKVGGVVYTLAKIWLLAFPLFWTVAIERRPVLRRVAPSIHRTSRWPAGMQTGAWLGILIAGGICGLYAIIEGYFGGINGARLREAAATAGFGSPWSYALLGIYLATTNSLLEEYVWRWFTYRACESLVPPVVAVALSGFFFTLHHVIVLAAYFPAWLTALASLGVFIGGCTWSWCYMRFGTVWPGYVSHLIVDVAILAIGWRLLFIL